jgi:hypothetical protein
MKELQDILIDYSFHGSTVNKVSFDNNQKKLVIDVDLPKRDFSENHFRCLIEYENVIFKEGTGGDINEGDWDGKSYGGVISYKPDDENISYMIKLTNPTRKDYMKLLFLYFSANGCKVIKK